MKSKITNKKRNSLNLRIQLKEALDYIKESSRYIYTSILLFALSLTLGIIFRGNLTFINDILREIADKTIGMNTLELIFFILQNNLLTSLLSMLAGVFLGIFPLFNTIANGAIVGYVLALAHEVTGTSSWWRLLPHGVFELPAIFISLGFGIKLGFAILSSYLKFYNKKRKTLVYLPPLIALLQSTLYLVSTLFSPQQNKISTLSFLPAPLMILFLFITTSLFYYIIFILITYATNKNLRKLQNTQTKKNIYLSINAFLLIVVPLLIVAAVIEGLLIALLN